ncbi:MAG: hypothetical protein LBJ44_01165 [Propionibacteriaceae bacterium]|nr:hypothetical protein [Propionibacteriaceae bacterium]
MVEATDLYTDQTPGPDDRSEEGWESLTLSPLGWLVPYVYEMLGPTPEQEVVIAQGSYALLRHCMAERGFKLFDAPPAAVPVVPRARGYDVRIGIMSGERARQTGYQLRKDDFGTGGDTGGAGLYPEWTREYEEALKGDGGCVFVSDDALAEGVVSTAGRLASEIDESSLAEAWASPAVESALVQWRSCMAEEGYAFTDPQEAYRSFRGFAVTTEFPEAGDSTAASTEIETAVRDAFCKAEIGFPRLWQQQLMEIRQAMVQENLPALQVYVAATAQWVANAQALIARYG